MLLPKQHVTYAAMLQGLEGLLTAPDIPAGRTKRASSDAQHMAINAVEPAALLRAATMHRSPDMDRTSTI